VIGLRDFGACQSPFNSFLNLIGLKPLRSRAASRREHAGRGRVLQHIPPCVGQLPGLPSHESYERAQKYLPKGPGAVLGFGVKGGKEAGRAFIDNLKLFSHVANVGDSRSLAIHPATTTHQQLSAEQQAETGVTDDYIRLAIGWKQSTIF